MAHVTLIFTSVSIMVTKLSIFIKKKEILNLISC